MKCLIIDDESASRESIKMMGRWDVFNIDEVFTANDGYSGLKIIRETMPEVVITDMKMDVMDGVSLLNAIQELPYRPCIIVVSGYTDYTYMHSAINSQVDDYVVKPVGPDKFNEILRHAIDRYQKRTSTNNIPIEDLIKRLSSQLEIERIGENKTFNTSRITRFVSQFDSFYLIIMRILNQQKVCLRYFNGLDDLMLFSIQSAMRSSLGMYYPLLQFRFDGDKISLPCLIGIKEKHISLQAEEIVRISDDFLLQVRNKYGIDGLLFVSHECYNIADFQESIKMIQNCIDNYNLYQPLKAMKVKDDYAPDDSALYFIRNEKSITDCLQEQRFDDVKELIRGFFSLQERERCRTVRGLQNSYIELLRILSKHAYAFNSEQPLWSYYQALSTINASISNVQELKEIFVNLVSYKSTSTEVTMPLSKQIIQYVSEHFSENITLEHLSKKFFVSREHISRLFKKATHQTFISYLQYCRLERASYLLQTTDNTLSVISEECGFHDESYFTKAFRKKYGISPSQFRKQL